MSKLAEHAEKLKRHVEEMREAASRDLILGPRPAPSTIELLLLAVIDLLEATKPPPARDYSKEPTAWDVGRHVARACASMNSRDAALGLILKSPCLWCGYNGEGYWSLRTHAESCPWHEVGGEMERLLVLGAYTHREREEDT